METRLNTGWTTSPISGIHRDERGGAKYEPQSLWKLGIVAVYILILSQLTETIYKLKVNYTTGGK